MTDVLEDGCCHACIHDPFLSESVRLAGVLAKCDRCGSIREAVSRFDLGQMIEPVLQAHFHPGEGESIAEIIEEIAGLEEDYAEAIADDLASIAGHRESGGETFYDCDDGYVVARRDYRAGDKLWEAFVDAVQTEARYFSREAEAYLDHIFGSLADDRTWRGEEVFVEAGPGKGLGAFFRARSLSSVKKAIDALSSPETEIGPRARGEGRPSRMNSAGVSVFYGALDTETCIAEIRPPVGSVVISGRFEVVRTIRLLDFDLLAKVVSKCSHFDPDYERKADRVQFLRRLGDLIAQPVMPGEEEAGYLPTQIVADYLAQRLTAPIDGILFRSTQTGGKGRNLILFHRASRVGDGPATAVEAMSADLAGLVAPAQLAGTGTTLTDRPTGPASSDDRAVTLFLDRGSLQVSNIQATRYEMRQRPAASWHIELEGEWIDDLERRQGRDW